jgi:lysozyme family protein
MTDLAALKTAETGRWTKMVITPALVAAFDHVAAHLVAAKARYETVSATTEVPWAVIAVIHEREASQSWAANLAQGDPWDKASIHVPRGRGPFKSWEEAACDALLKCPPYTGTNNDWSIGGALVALEEYNGLGYWRRGIPSPYLWAGTDQYVKGKYIADGHFDPEARDKQIGCAGLLRRMMVLDPTANWES